MFKILKLNNDKVGSIFKSHGKQHGEHKGKWINPGSGHMNPTVQQPGSNSSIRELLLLINKGGFCR